MASIKIELAKGDKGTYSPGEIVKGSVIVSSKKEFTMNTLRLDWIGEARVDSRGLQSSYNYFHETFYFYDKKPKLRGNDTIYPPSFSPVTNPPKVMKMQSNRNYRFEFELILKRPLPTSIKHSKDGRFANINYTIHVYMYDANDYSPMSQEKSISVIEHVSERLPNADDKIEDQKIYYPSPYDNITFDSSAIKLELGKSKARPGDKIPFVVRIWHKKTKKSGAIQIGLQEELTVYHQGQLEGIDSFTREYFHYNLHTEKQKSKAKDQPKVYAQELKGEFRIPQNIKPSISLGVSKIIQRMYYIVVKVGTDEIFYHKDDDKPLKFISCHCKVQIVTHFDENHVARPKLPNHSSADRVAPPPYTAAATGGLATIGMLREESPSRLQLRQHCLRESADPRQSLDAPMSPMSSLYHDAFLDSQNPRPESIVPYSPALIEPTNLAATQAIHQKRVFSPVYDDPDPVQFASPPDNAFSRNHSSYISSSFQGNQTPSRFQSPIRITTNNRPWSTSTSSSTSNSVGRHHSRDTMRTRSDRSSTSPRSESGARSVTSPTPGRYVISNQQNLNNDMFMDLNALGGMTY